MDYYSNYLEVKSLNTATSRTVITALSKWFSHYGVPEVLMPDNGPQFSSREFAQFATECGFKHITSSPHYPQSNGKAEKAVDIIERLFRKWKESRTSEFKALLDWRNTPSEGTGVSPAPVQNLAANNNGTSRYNTCKEKHAMKERKARQRSYYNCTARRLPPLQEGVAV